MIIVMNLLKSIKFFVFIIVLSLFSTSVQGQKMDKIEQSGEFYLLTNEIDTVQTEILPTTPEHKYIFLKNNSDSVLFVDKITFCHRADSLIKLPISRLDTLLYNSNPLTLPLIYIGKDIHEVWSNNHNLWIGLYPEKKTMFYNVERKASTSEFAVAELRKEARKYIANNNIQLYTTTLDRLPQLSTFMSRPIQRKGIQKLNVHDDKIVLNATKIEYKTVTPIYWIKRANAILQFSQNYISPNWYQGGSSNLAFLSTFLAEFNYDNRKNTQWDNKIEWRVGFNSVEADTLRKVSTNDDLLRYISKFGLRASGNWFYSVSGEFSTQLFNNYTKVNSPDLKARFITPVRVNIGLGMDYKYKQTLSVMIAPVSFKYIYANDTVNVKPSLFGIKPGENQLKQIGSSVLFQLKYSPMVNWDLTSKFSFYTDYKKIETDLEIVNNFTVNRFLTARILINPRYDNTVILKGSEKARIQFKELLSFGFSYRFL